MVTDFSVDFDCSPCLHRHVVTVTTGGMHHSEGEVWDDIHTYLQCLDCGEYLTEPEIRARWNGTEVPDANAAPPEDDDVPF